MGKLYFPQVIFRPCIPFVLALMAGLVLGAQVFESNLPVSYWVPISLLWAFPVVILLLPAAAIWTGCSFFFVTGLSLMTFLSPGINTPPVPTVLLNHQLQHLSGVIMEDPVIYPDKTRFTIRLTSYSNQGQDRPAQGIILLGVKGLTKGFVPGDPVRFVSRLRLIEGYHNPGGFDFEKVMARKGIRVSGFMENPELLVLSGPSLRVWPLNRLFLLRNRVSELIDSKVSPPFNGLAQAILTADQSKSLGK